MSRDGDAFTFTAGTGLGVAPNDADGTVTLYGATLHDATWVRVPDELGGGRADVARRGFIRCPLPNHDHDVPYLGLARGVEGPDGISQALGVFECGARYQWFAATLGITTD